MSYQSRIYPLRGNPVRFANALVGALSREWTENIAVGTAYRAERPGSGAERPQELDKARVRALLDAWSRNISDRYLEYDIVRQRDRGFPRRRSVEELVNEEYERLRHNYPRGAVKFLYNELSRDPEITRVRMHPAANFNWMYSTLLHWCDQHCYRLVTYLQRYATMGGVGGGGSSLGIVYQAARRYIHNSYTQGNNVYARYFVPRTWSDYVLGN